MSGRTLLMLLMAVLVAGTAVIVVKNRAQPAATQNGPKILVATPAVSYARINSFPG
jgi:hypothetical protein